MTNAPDFNATCGHYVPPGAKFCPECGRPIPIGGNPSPSVSGGPGLEPAPALDASASLDPSRPEPPRWPWEINDDDELHSVRSDPTVIPPYFGANDDQKSTSPAPKGPTEPPRSGRPRVLWMVLSGVVVLAIVAAGVVLLSRHPGGASADDASATTKPTVAATTAKPTPSPTPTVNYAALRATPEGKAAVALAALLNEAVSQRGEVSLAISNVSACKPKLQTDTVTFGDAANNRRGLLGKLGSLSGRSTLPADLIQELTYAWQSSAIEYTDLAHWADDAIYHGCSKATINSDANLRASTTPSTQAAEDKKAFLRLWAPIASKYNLATYQYWEL
jgi:hypothetical protein